MRFPETRACPQPIAMALPATAVCTRRKLLGVCFWVELLLPNIDQTAGHSVKNRRF